jgi:MFS transporter, ACS family, glucarate transporter
MTEEAFLTGKDNSGSPTLVRHAVLFVLTLMSVLLYLDRFAVGIAAEYIREDLRMSQTQMAWFVSAFFWSYAFCQVPGGWFSDRFGGRIMLTIYILAWSIVTGLMGFAHAVWMVLWLRILCGATQAGAYPTSAGLIRQWYPISNRGTASSIVALGGRFGAVLAPLLTARLILAYVPVESDSTLRPADFVNADAFVARFDEQKDVGKPRQIFVTGFLAHLSTAEQHQVRMGVAEAKSSVEARMNADKEPKRIFDLHDWVPLGSGDHAIVETPFSGFTEIMDSLTARMSEKEFIDFSEIPLPFYPKQGRKQRSLLGWLYSSLFQTEAGRLLERKFNGTELTRYETLRLNRLAMESLFPNEIRKVHGSGWRPTIILYGIAGLIVAVAFAAVTHNSPAEHSWCNQAERELIDDEATRTAKMKEPGNPDFPFRAFLMSPSLWGNSMTQFLTNIGWLFVVTSLPRYLDKVHSVSLVTNGFMTAFPSGIGIIGLFAGGRATDWAVRAFGLKRGRQIPLAASRFTAAGGYAMCLLLNILFAPNPENWWLPWLYIVGLCIASMSTDFGSPAIWSYAQDVGGRYTASILGWGNMWGNIGAAVAPLIYNGVLGENPTLDDWNTVFAVCCGVFIVAGFCAMLLDSTKPLTVQRISSTTA